MSDFEQPYAVLDSDFIIKSATVKTDEISLFDVIDLLKDRHCKCCHEQIVKEVSRHSDFALAVFSEKISRNEIRVFTDKEIISGIKTSYNHSNDMLSCRFYLNMLRKICNTFAPITFKEYISELEQKINDCSTVDSFLMLLNAEEAKLGEKKGLGEVKDTLLIKYINMCTKESVYKFCSDDQAARSSIIAYSMNNGLNIRCYPPFSLFYLAHKQSLLSSQVLDKLIMEWKSDPLFGNQNIEIRASQKDINKKEKISPDGLYNLIVNDKLLLASDGFLVRKD